MAGRLRFSAFLLGLLSSSLGCQWTSSGPLTSGPPGGAPVSSEPRECALIAINDTYRIEPSPDGTGGMAKVRSLRLELEKKYPDLILLHAGDFLFPSLLSRKYLGAQMVDVLNQLDGSDGFDPRLLVTFGNHEFDDDKANVVNARLYESRFQWLSSNIEFAKTRASEGVSSVPMVAEHKVAKNVIRSCGGMKVGFFALTTEAKTAPYVARFLDPILVAKQESKRLRENGAQIVVGLTHQDIEIDSQILMTLGAEGPDLIVGGHEHAKQERTHSGRSVFKADADSRTASVIKINWTKQGPSVQQSWVTLDDAIPQDPETQALVDGWLKKHEQAYCQEKLNEKPGCLSEKLTFAAEPLIAEELSIRRFETNLGNFVADQMLAAFTKEGAQIAFVNAGTLRLNYNIAKGAAITRRNVEELFAYPAPLRVIELTGATLTKVLQRAVTGWTGQGHWLQIAGFAFKHDPKNSSVSDVTLLGPNPRRIDPQEKLLAVVNTFLLDPTKGQDGYVMLSPSNIVGPDSLRRDLVSGPDLKQIVVDAFKIARAEGIAPRLEGRICNAAQEKAGPCLVKTSH